MYGLITVESYAARKRGDASVSAARLYELIASGHLPHVIFDGKPFVREAELTEWIKENLLVEHPGMSYPKALIIAPRKDLVRRIPPALLPMAEHLHMLPEPFYPAGIYFLVKGDEVVYAGQSVGPVARVISHRNEGAKNFDYAVFLPVPKERLDEVEGAFIRVLKPALNSGYPYPKTGKETEVLAEYGLSREAA